MLAKHLETLLGELCRLCGKSGSVWADAAIASKLIPADLLHHGKRDGRPSSADLLAQVRAGAVFRYRFVGFHYVPGPAPFLWQQKVKCFSSKLL